MSDHKPYPPFVTTRSPSYERAQHEGLHPSAVRDAQVVAVLCELADAEQNAKQVCARIAELLSDATLAAQVRQGIAAHDARLLALQGMIEAAEGAAPRPSEAHQVLLHGPESVVCGPSDRATLQALARMRDELGAAYATAVGTAELDDAQRATLVEFAAAVRNAQPANDAG